jgi:sodium-dependent dicarboxylate transporter 2/3/5
MSITFPDAPEVTFAKWLLFALPVSLSLFAVTFVYLWWRYCPRTVLRSDDSKFRAAYLSYNDDILISCIYAQLGPLKAEEILVLAGILITVLLWLFRADLDFSTFIIPGWTRLFPYPSYIDDGTIAIFMGLLLFVSCLK